MAKKVRLTTVSVHNRTGIECRVDILSLTNPGHITANTTMRYFVFNSSEVSSVKSLQERTYYQTKVTRFILAKKTILDQVLLSINEDLQNSR